MLLTPSLYLVYCQPHWSQLATELHYTILSTSLQSTINITAMYCPHHCPLFWQNYFTVPVKAPQRSLHSVCNMLYCVANITTLYLQHYCTPLSISLQQDYNWYATSHNSICNSSLLLLQHNSTITTSLLLRFATTGGAGPKGGSVWKGPVSGKSQHSHRCNGLCWNTRNWLCTLNSSYGWTKI